MMPLILLMFIFTLSYGGEDFYSRVRNFSVELLSHTQSKQDDLVISPYSVWCLMAMVSIGAFGENQEQIFKAILLPTNKTILYNGIMDMKRVLVDSIDGADLRNRNFVFMDQGFSILKEYEYELIHNMDASIHTLNFTNAKKAAEDANRIIEINVPHLLNTMIPEDFSEALMIMTNGLYFNGYWKYRFSVLDTNEETHYDEAVKRNFYLRKMHLKANVPYLKLPQINGSILELPFGNDGKWCTLFIYPDKDVNITYVYNKIQLFTLTNVVDTIDSDVRENGVKEINIKIPRFRLVSDPILNKPLKGMGLYDLFESGLGSFLGIARDDIYIGAFEHFAEISVAESGIRAYAKTPGSDEFKVHRGGHKAEEPFIFFIIEKPTRTIIFGGFYTHERYY